MESGCIKFNDYIYSTRVLPDCNLITFIYEKFFIHKINGEVIKKIENERYNVCTDFVYDKKIISNKINEIVVYDFETGEEKIMPRNFFSPVSCSSINGKHFIACLCKKVNMLEIYNIETLELESEINIYVAPSSIFKISWSQGGKYILISSNEDTILWDFHSKKEYSKMKQNTCVRYVSWFRDDFLAFSSNSIWNKIFLWDVNEDKISQITTDVCGPHVVSFSPNGKQIAISSRHGEIEIHKINSKEKPIVWQDCDATNIYSISWFPDGKRIAYDGKKTIRILTLCKWNDKNNYLFSKKIREKVFFIIMCSKKTNIPIEIWLIILDYVVSFYSN
jgi:WD40 repeat protein